MNSKPYFGAEELSNLSNEELDALWSSGDVTSSQIAEAAMMRHVNDQREPREAALNAMLDDHPHNYLKAQMRQHEAKNEPLSLAELQQFLDTSDAVLADLELSVPDRAAIALLKAQRQNADHNAAAIMALGERYQDHGSEHAPEGYADKIMRLAQASGHFDQ